MKLYDEDGNFTKEQLRAMGERMARSIMLSKTSKAGVAAEIGVSRSAVTQYCDGSSSIRLENLAKFCKITKASMDYIVFGADPEMEQMVSAVLQEVISKRSPKAKA